MTIQYPDTTSLILTTFSYVSHLRCATMLDDESEKTILRFSPCDGHWLFPLYNGMPIVG
jgi:hypothetical protein